MKRKGAQLQLLDHAHELLDGRLRLLLELCMLLLWKHLQDSLEPFLQCANTWMSCCIKAMLLQINEALKDIDVAAQACAWASP